MSGRHRPPGYGRPNYSREEHHSYTTPDGIYVRSVFSRNGPPLQVGYAEQHRVMAEYNPLRSLLHSLEDPHMQHILHRSMHGPTQPMFPPSAVQFFPINQRAGSGTPPMTRSPFMPGLEGFPPPFLPMLHPDHIGDYAGSDEEFDRILTGLRENDPTNHAVPAASASVIAKLPTVKFGSEPPTARRSSVASSSRSKSEGHSMARSVSKTLSNRLHGSRRSEAKRQEKEKEKEAKAGEGGKEDEGNKECPICAGDYEVGDVLKILPCGHRYHGKCVDEWLRQSGTCPDCRAQVK